MRSCLAAALVLALATSCAGEKAAHAPLTAESAVAGAAPDALSTALMFNLLPGRLPGSQPALLAAIAESNDPRLATPIIDLLRFSEDLPWAPELLTQLTGQDHGTDWHTWVEWASAQPLSAPPGYDRWKGELFAFVVEEPRFAAMIPAGVQTRVRLDEVVWGGVAVDGIPALDRAPQIPGAQAAWLEDDEYVVGVSLEGDARAYPLRILGAHEMANDVVGGVPVSLSYCTLCGSAVLYGADAGDRVYDFGSSGLLMRSNKLMYDRQTSSLWNQITGEPVIGPLADSGIRLPRLPAVVSTWGEWKSLHPKSTVLSLETGHDRTYARSPYADYFADEGLMFPVARRASSLPDKERVFTAVLDGAAKAWPLSLFESRRIVVDRIGETPVVLVAGGPATATSEPAGRSVRMYRWDGEAASVGEKWAVVDSEGAAWTVTEEALVGSQGERRERLPGHVAFWFGWFAFFPETEIGEAPR
ncbi:MAG: DUF3179 domain-containing protein [Deltaproteobacteria bacterium]|nr:DUF3179 domain-containing protein [Deltaproteobacteria bacterium]